MKWKWIIPVLGALVFAGVILSPTVMWDGRKQFNLALSPAAIADTESLFYQDQWNPEAGQRLCEFYRNEDIPDIDHLFRPVSIAPDGTFVVEVPTFGTTRLWGLWRKRGMYEYVILMGKKSAGVRVFKCVWVKTTEPIDLK